MKDYIAQRSLEVGKYILDTGCTVRSAAKKFGFSKSTIHQDVTERLLNVDPQLYAEVRRVLDYNTDVRHIRGGNSTKQRYSK